MSQCIVATSDAAQNVPPYIPSPAAVSAYLEDRRVDGREAADKKAPEVAQYVKNARLDAIKKGQALHALEVQTAGASGSSRVLTPPPPSSPSIHDSDIPNQVDILDDVSEGTYGGDPEHRREVLRRRAEAEENRRLADQAEYEELVEEAQGNVVV